MSDDYKATAPPPLPAYHKVKTAAIIKTVAKVVSCAKCPKCGRWTYIVKTEETASNYSALGCFWEPCRYAGPLHPPQPQSEDAQDGKQ